MSHKIIIFDFDGTIADNLELSIDIFYELTKQQTRASESEVARLRKMSLLQVARELRVPIWKGLKLHKRARQRQWERREELHPVPGIITAIKQLHKAGNRLFILTTNNERNVQYFLEKHKLTQYFDEVYAGVRLFRKKGNLRMLTKQQHLRPADCYYIGDESLDMDAANQIGMKAVAVAWGYNDVELLASRNPVLVVRNPKELVPAFAAIDKH
jgi:phosphoglycolate phosphatase